MPAVGRCKGGHHKTPKCYFFKGELDEEVVSSILEHTTLNGVLSQKTQKTQKKCYTLDEVLAVGYRVKPKFSWLLFCVKSPLNLLNHNR
jgi:hypothetical protein